MSLFGKILVFLNILGAAGFIALAAMDYTKRQTWTYAVYRHQLLIEGIPVDEEQTNREGQKLSELIGEKTQQDLFPGQPVKTQVEEVTAVRDRLEGPIRSMTEKKQQILAYASQLLPLARTFSDRQHLTPYLTWLANDQNFTLLKKQLDQAYQKAHALAVLAATPTQPRRTFAQAFLEAVNAMGGQPTDPFAVALLKELSPNPKKTFAQAFEDSLEAQRVELQTAFDQAFREGVAGEHVESNGAITRLTREERRQAIARLLFNLVAATPAAPNTMAADPVATPAFKRVLNVIGLKAAIREVNDQAEVMKRIAAEALGARDRDRVKFALVHSSVLEQIRERAAQVTTATALLERKTKDLGEQQALVTRREDDIKEYRKQLTTQQKMTADRLEELRKMSEALFATRVKVRDALNENQKLEKEIRGLEQSR